MQPLTVSFSPHSILPLLQEHKIMCLHAHVHPLTHFTRKREQARNHCYPEPLIPTQ